MAGICLYFHAHQPLRLKRYSFFSIGKDEYFTDEDNKNDQILSKVVDKCYLPTNKLLLKLLKKHDDFRVSFSISGILLEQLEEKHPEVIDSFQKMVDTGRVELLCETYYHSLSFLFSPQEFESQVKLHEKKLKQVFGYQPQAFRNTELIYNNDVAQLVEKLGYKTILAEGVDRYLGWRSPNFVYKPFETKKLRLLLKNYRLSDDIAFRFSNRDWHEWPLTTTKFVNWLADLREKAEVVNLFMDYETFGEHQWEDTGVFEFLENLPQEIKKHKDLDFMNVSQAAWKFEVKDEVNIPEFTSWADSERDLSAWLENPMQKNAARALYELEAQVMRCKDQNLIELWRKLTASDLLYYMSTKTNSDGEVHDYFSPYESVYEAYVSFMNVLHDLRVRVYTVHTKEYGNSS